MPSSSNSNDSHSSPATKNLNGHPNSKHHNPAASHLGVPNTGGLSASRPLSAADMSAMMEEPPHIAARPDGRRAQILVLKVGTSTLVNAQNGAVSLANLGKFVDAVCDLKDRGYYVVLISSGAVGFGCIHMHLSERPKKLVEKQAVSAIGQCRLVRLWEDIFAIRERKAAQLLLTRTDLIDRPRFVSFRNTLLQLLKMDCIPIINENDALAGGELKFGDNDTLGAYVSVSIGASWFFMLTDVDCLFTANPRHHSDARPIAYVGNMDKISQMLDEGENEGTSWGSGGMKTKIMAAKLCVATGIHTGLCHGASPERILDIVAFAESGASKNPAASKAEVFPIQPISKSAVCGLRKVANSGPNSTPSVNPPAGLRLGEMTNHLLPLPGSVTPASPASGQNSDEEDTSLSSTDDAPSPGATSTTLSHAPLVASGTSDIAPSCTKNCIITFEAIDRMPYVGTIFAGQHCTQQLRDQRRWILSLPVRGKIFVNEQSARSVIEKRKSLTAAGIVAVKDVFYPGEAVAMYAASACQELDEKGNEHDQAELARCLVNFTSAELDKIKGKKTFEFQHILGYYCAHEVAYKSNIIFVNPTPVYEKYKVEITDEMIMSSDDEEGVTGLETPEYNPIPIPVEGGKLL